MFLDKTTESEFQKKSVWLGKKEKNELKEKKFREIEVSSFTQTQKQLLWSFSLLVSQYETME